MNCRCTLTDAQFVRGSRLSVIRRCGRVLDRTRHAFLGLARTVSSGAVRCFALFGTDRSPPESGTHAMADFFPEIPVILYEGPQSRNPLAFKHYNPDEVVEGQTLRDLLRFSVCYWHTFRATGSDPFGAATLQRPWDDGSNSLENAVQRVRAAFEFISKLGAPFYSFHDRDVAPEGATLKESNRLLDEVVTTLKEEQQRTGIRLLWGTANLFSHPRYLHGAATSCNADVFAYAAAQVKKAIEVTHELRGE